MPMRAWICLTIAALLLGACGSGGRARSSSGNQFDLPNPAPLAAAPANATPTATPFQPMPPTPPGLEPPPGGSASLSASSQSTPLARTWGDYPGPTIFTPVEIPPPMGLLPQPESQINILLMGSDQRPYDGGFRTDVLLLLTLNTELGKVNLTSFPRDLYVYLPGYTMERVNTAQVRGGFQLTSLTFEYNFGVRPDHWALINFGGFQAIINALGGINVQVARTLSDHRDGYGTYTVPAGTVHMDGETALWYVRSRYTTSDFDRTRRQQEVLQAIFFRLISLNAVANASELYNQYNQTVLTDMSLDDILPLLPLATQVADSNNISRFAITSSDVSPWTNPYSGAQVLLPNRQAVEAVMEQALNIR